MSAETKGDQTTGQVKVTRNLGGRRFPLGNRLPNIQEIPTKNRQYREDSGPNPGESEHISNGNITITIYLACVL